MADRYWVGGSGTWNGISTANWSISPGGGSGASVPTSADDVFFEAQSGGGSSYTVSGGFGNPPCRSCTITQPTGGDVTFQTIISLECYGSFSTYSGAIFAATFFGINFNGTGTHTVDFGGVTQRNVSFVGSGTYSLSSALTTDGATGVSHSAGTLTTNNFAVNSRAFNSTGATSRTINMGSSVFTLTATDGTTPWNLTGSNLTFNCGTSTVKIVSSNSDSTARLFNGLSKTYHTVWFSGTNPNAAFTITGANTFSDLKEDFGSARTIKITNGIAQTVTSWNITGSAGNIITIESTSSGNSFSLVKSGGGKVRSDYLSLKDSAASPTNTWYAGTHSTNVSGNTGWFFRDPPKSGVQVIIY